jgi:hypothetical protein
MLIVYDKNAFWWREVRHRTWARRKRIRREDSTLPKSEVLGISLGYAVKEAWYFPIMTTVPALLATVRLRNRGTVYLVVDVDSVRETVELVSITGEPQHLVPNVPVSAIHELVEVPPDDL